MRCGEARIRLSEQPKQEALPTEVISHVRRCPDCGRYQAGLRVWEQGVELLGQETAPALSTTFWREFEARLNEESNRWGFDEIMERIGRRVVWATGIITALVALGLALLPGSTSAADESWREVEAHLSRTFVLEHEATPMGELTMVSGEEVVGFWINSDGTEEEAR